jgi:sphingolipid delta-4 desaturase
LAYLFASSVFSIGLHPLGARWIQEHFPVFAGQYTTSYYGPANAFVFNAGLHVEHHDLPFIAWHRLPAVRWIAPEYYDGLGSVQSWTALLVRFIFDRRLTLERR